VLEQDGEFFSINISNWDELIASPNPHSKLASAKTIKISRPNHDRFLAPTVSQEIWAYGAFLLTGTGVVPDDNFTLKRGDLIRIDIEGIGSFENHVA
jgi:2-keto-4-pentenoate hydratase/2-oxohepta-3-ene-1,7-dioic acid hydratase in catechol pathway